MASDTLSPSHSLFLAAVEQGLKGALPAPEWLAPLLECDDRDAAELYRISDRVRAEHLGDAVHLRALVEFSNYCRRNCHYCGLRRDNRKLARYRMTPEEILKTAQEAKELGYRTLVLQSGEDLSYSPEDLAALIREIKAHSDLAVTLSIGERDFAAYRLLKEAGADRYLLRIETTDAGLFSRLHPDDDLAERKECLYRLRELDYQLGTGVMVGLPDQTAESLAQDIVWMHELGAEMLGVGPFIPHPETPLKDARGGTVDATLRLLAVLRLVFPKAHMPATTAMGSLHPEGRELALKAGANVIMPNITPQKYRSQYEIYPNKIGIRDDARLYRGYIAGRIKAIGRSVAVNHGHTHRKR